MWVPAPSPPPPLPLGEGWGEGGGRRGLRDLAGASAPSYAKVSVGAIRESPVPLPREASYSPYSPRAFDETSISISSSGTPSKSFSMAFIEWGHVLSLCG